MLGMSSPANHGFRWGRWKLGMSAMTEHPTGQLEEHLLRLLLPAAEAEVTAHLAACAQ